MSEPGYFALGLCWSCGQPFTFNPELVPSIPIGADGQPAPDGTRQPICRACVTLANTRRPAEGLAVDRDPAGRLRRRQGLPVVSASERRITQLEDENHKLREQLARVAGGAASLEMESGVNRQLNGFVTVRWGAEVGQLSPDEARQHGLAMLQVAEAAEADAALLRSLREIDADEEMGFALLRLIRDGRTR
jgi:hypothetical protein